MKSDLHIPASHNSAGTSTPGPVRLAFLLAVVIVAICLLPTPDFAAGQEWATRNPYKVEAAFLRNFAHYVTWPAGAFAGPGSPWRIGILGRDPFGDILEKTFRGRTE
ncbi:MAG TPA: YfiR family protein, partial [Geobacteraceae bacterium]